MRQVLAIPSQLGPLLKAARKQAHMSQEELAKRVNISQSRMSHMELNPGSISLEQLLAIFGALGIEVVLGSRSAANISLSETAEPTTQRATLSHAPHPVGKPPTEW